MEMPKLTQLSTSEFKFDSPSSFCLNAHNNCMVFNNASEVTIFELMYNCDSITLMPYSSKQLKVSQDRPITKLIRQVDLVAIYENATVQESQELACDIIYTGDCAVEPLKAKVLQADVVNMNNEYIACVLTNYGCCKFYEKDSFIGEWKKTAISLVNILVNEVFPAKKSPSHIKTYNDLKSFSNMFTITCFTISQPGETTIIYLGTAAGYVVALKYNETTCKFEPYCNLKTSLNRISYITTCNNFILAGCDQGRVLMLKINFNASSIEELEYLWSITDGMSCQKAIFSYSHELSSFLVAFCKASHVLVFRLDTQGTVKSSSTLYIGGIKVTGKKLIFKIFI